MAKKNLQQLRKGREFVAHAEQRGATVRNGKGCHKIVTTALGSTAVPIHNTDLGIGLRSKLVKTFIALGLATLPLLCLLLEALRQW